MTSQSPSSAILSLTSFLLLLVAPPIYSELYEGDACTIGRSPGICTQLQKCPLVYQELRKGKAPSSLCGYSDFEPIICCPSEDSSTTELPTVTVGPFVNDGRGRVAKAKCEEYAQSVYVLVNPPILTADPKPVNVSLCAINSRMLIIGGIKAKSKEFPHMAAVGYNSTEGIKWFCGGTLISDQFVLTAAHCLYDSIWGNAAWVRLGDLNLVRTDDDAKPQEIKIVQRIKYPKYKRPSAYHDIALLKLERKVEFNAWVRPSCLPYSLPDNGVVEKAVATGWGLISWFNETTSGDLLKVTIPLVPHSQCNSEHGVNTKLGRGIVDEWQICAGEVGKDTCQGDSGGPLSTYNEDYNCMYNVIGVTSLGNLCGSVIPSIYTRVYYYLPWIESVVWPNSL